MTGTDENLLAGKKCFECDGRGKIWVMESPFEPEKDSEEKCWRCDGTGILEAKS